MTNYGFFLYEKSTDDCYGSLSVGIQERPGRDLCELLCTSGYFSHVNISGFKAFFALSFQNLPGHITSLFEAISIASVFIKKSPVQFTQSVRLSNRYVKQQASKD
ncbi:hypothetical protein EDC96DRAFT_527053 [Choanephora cucurbitarum]|nr:hypothetical protein EDC96DRAFT_527053 [Choanephora cucurbitarum]